MNSMEVFKPDTRQVAEALKQVLLNDYRSMKKLAESDRRQDCIHPSALSLGCKLRVYHDLICTPFEDEPMTFKRAMTLLTGHILGRVIQTIYKRKYGNGFDYEVRLGDGKKAFGSADGLFYFDDGIHVLEIKSIGVSGFNKLITPHKSHEYQTAFYTRYSGATAKHILYICRDNFDIKIYDGRPDKEVEERVCSDIQEIYDAIESGIPPSPDPKWEFDGYCTKKCGYRGVCPAANKNNRRRFSA